MNDSFWYELRVICIAACTSVKCYSPKSFPSFKAFLELSFNKILYVHMLQRLFEISVQRNACNFFFGLLIRRICRLLSRCWIRMVVVSLVILVLKLQKTRIGTQAIWNSLPQIFIQNLFDSMPCRIATFFAERGDYTKIDFKYLILFYLFNFCF